MAETSTPDYFSALGKQLADAIADGLEAPIMRLANAVAEQRRDLDALLQLVGTHDELLHTHGAMIRKLRNGAKPRAPRP